MDTLEVKKLEGFTQSELITELYELEKDIQFHEEVKIPSEEDIGSRLRGLCYNISQEDRDFIVKYYIEAFQKNLIKIKKTSMDKKEKVLKLLLKKIYDPS